MSVLSIDAARRGVATLAVAGVCWGTGGLLGRLLAESTALSPLAVAALRLSVGGGLVVVYLLASGRRLPRDRRAWLRIGATGLLAALFQGAYFTAVAWSSVSLATLVAIGSGPVLVLALTCRAAGRAQVAGVVLALLGLVLLVGVPTAGGGAVLPGTVLPGAAAAVLAGAGFAVMTVLASRPVAGLDDVTTTGVGFLVGGLVLVPIVSATSGWTFVLNAHTVGLLLALGVVPTALAYTCYFRGLRATSAGTGSVLALLEPLTAAVLAAWLLGERLGPTGLAGGVVLGLSMLLAARRPVAGRVRTS